MEIIFDSRENPQLTIAEKLLAQKGDTLEGFLRSRLHDFELDLEPLLKLWAEQKMGKAMHFSEATMQYITRLAQKHEHILKKFYKLD